MIELTDWETGDVILVDPRAILSARRIPASVSDLSGSPKEYGARTRIDTARDTMLVRETVEEIRSAIKCN